ncbi:hypothetical protein LXA43DRAFT_1185595 [Ganoderma leucocontextum]|nr:hypothetical protein LXA43DRAFT_1185595 [Ganoderma leucocontextum]
MDPAFLSLPGPAATPLLVPNLRYWELSNALDLFAASYRRPELRQFLSMRRTHGANVERLESDGLSEVARIIHALPGLTHLRSGGLVFQHALAETMNEGLQVLQPCVPSLDGNVLDGMPAVTFVQLSGPALPYLAVRGGDRLCQRSPLLSIREPTFLQHHHDPNIQDQFLVTVGGGPPRSLEEVKDSTGMSELGALELALAKSSVRRVKIVIVTTRRNRVTAYWTSQIAGYFPILLQLQLLDIQYTYCRPVTSFAASSNSAVVATYSRATMIV